MTNGQAKQLVIIAAAASGALASVPAVTRNETPDIKIAVGATFVAIVLLVLAEIHAQLAGMLALLVLASSMFAVGPAVYDTWTKATGHKPTPR